MDFDNFCSFFECHSILAEKQQTKQTNYSFLSLFASLYTQDTFQGGIIVEWKKLSRNPSVQFPTCFTYPGFGESEESIFLFLGVLGIKILFLGVPRSFEETIFSWFCVYERQRGCKFWYWTSSIDYFLNFITKGSNIPKFFELKNWSIFLSLLFNKLPYSVPKKKNSSNWLGGNSFDHFSSKLNSPHCTVWEGHRQQIKLHPTIWQYPLINYLILYQRRKFVKSARRQLIWSFLVKVELSTLHCTAHAALQLCVDRRRTLPSPRSRL